MDNDNDACSSEKTFFLEKDEVIGLIDDICQRKYKLRSFDQQFESLSKILLNYQEQPQLLGPHLASIMKGAVDRMILFVERTDLSLSDTECTYGLHEVCKVIQLLCRVRGHKHVSVLFPNEGQKYLEPCFFLLQQQNKTDYSTWETRYVLLLWLGALFLVPFHISSIVDKTLIKNVVSLCSEYLSDTGPPREAAALCLASLLIRSDMDVFLAEFLQFSVKVIADLASTDNNEQHPEILSRRSFLCVGMLYCLAQIFKRGHRNNLLIHAPAVLETCLTALEDSSHQTALSRKLLCKLFQRIAMTFLPPRVAEWRYTRGKRSLNLNLQSATAAPVTQTVEAEAAEDAPEQDTYVSNELESAIGSILSLLGDKDTVVRWSAAKGIGRVTMLLPKDYADEIVGAVCESFSNPSDDGSWHGGCLALAELARRGLLLPERLAEAVPFVEQAILFDLMRGQHSVGAHVRDAACYVCWAFARAYSPQIMSTHSKQLSNSMLITALFDREVNCRRAASAAFQENVGRQGNENFPNGIEIITVADYFSVGNRTNAYLKIAPVVAAMSETINRGLLTHLFEVKAFHWDEEIRVLASKAAAKLAIIDSDFAVGLLRTLIDKILVTSSQLSVRHGAILTTAEVLLSLAQHGRRLPSDLEETIVGLVPALEKARLYRGRGGELVRSSACLLIRNIAQACLPVSSKMQISFLDSLNEQLRQPFETLQLAARDALRQVLHAYFSSKVEDPADKLQAKTVTVYLKALEEDQNVAATRGCALALGTLPIRLATQPEGTFDKIVACLDAGSLTSKLISGEYDAATCRNCIESLVELSERVCESEHYSEQRLTQCFEILVRACSDYSVDKRGDIGSWTRIAALNGFERLLTTVVRRQQRQGVAVRVAHSDLLVGDCFLSSYGVCTAQSVAVSGDGQYTTVSCSFSAQSLGGLADVDSCDSIGTAQQTNCVERLICVGNTVVAFRKPSDSTVVASTAPVNWLSGAMVAQAFSCVLKQLAEKLDSVRETAGTIFLHLCESDVPISAADRVVFRRALECAVDKLKGTADTKVGSSHSLCPSDINWGNPYHVFCVLAESLRSPVYFHAIFSGLVVSIGGLTATIAEASTDSLLDFLRRIRGESGQSAHMDLLLTSIDKLFTECRKDDRIICPLLKSVGILLREKAIAPSEDCGKADSSGEGSDGWTRKSFADRLLVHVLTEMKDCLNVSKLCLCVDTLVLIMAFDSGLARYLCMKTLVRYLGHKYPKFRKHCSVLLYLETLSDPCLVGNGYQGIGTASSRCGFFRSADDADIASNVLTETAWELAAKEQIGAAKKTLQTLCNFDDALPAVEQEERLLLGESLYSAFNATVGAKGVRSAKVVEKVDEYSSYEELVRTAGY